MSRSSRRQFLSLAAGASLACALPSFGDEKLPEGIAGRPNQVRGDEITPAQKLAVARGLDSLSKTQQLDGCYSRNASSAAGTQQLTAYHYLWTSGDGSSTSYDQNLTGGVELATDAVGVPALVRLHLFHVLQSASPHVADLADGIFPLERTDEGLADLAGRSGHGHGQRWGRHRPNPRGCLGTGE